MVPQIFFVKKGVANQKKVEKHWFLPTSDFLVSFYENNVGKIFQV
jgi:hypothetical protein